MSAGALAAVGSSASQPFTLRVGGTNMIGRMPLGDEYPVRISETTDGPGQMSFSLEDTSGLVLEFGSEVILTDNRNSRRLFGGHLVNVRSTRRPAGYGRMASCTAIGYDAWLDWRTVTSWSSRNSKSGSNIDSDRKMVQQLVNKFGGRHIEAPDATVDATNVNMDVVKVSGVTLREAITRVADTATVYSDSPSRYFYVDVMGRLHYFRDYEVLSAPYRISDGSYVRTVLATSGLVAFWTLQEPTGTTAYDANGYANGPGSGAVRWGVPGGVVNEPGLDAVYLGGTSGFLAPTGANIHPGDTFTIEFWFKRGVTGTTQTVWSGGSGDVEVGFTSGDALVVYLEGTGNHFVSDNAYTGGSWRHVAITRSPGNTDVYVDGSSITGTTTARTFVASSGTANIGRRKSSTDRYYTGSLQMLALYSSKLSAATVLAHYNQGISLAPESLVLELDASDGREEVYVAGADGRANESGSGWVRPGQIPGVSLRTAFGKDEPPRWEIVERQDSTGTNKRLAYGASFLKRNNDPRIYGSFTVTGYDGWRVGQRVFVTDSALGLVGDGVDIKQLDTDLLLGNGVMKYEVSLGRSPRTGVRTLSRANRRKR